MKSFIYKNKNNYGTASIFCAVLIFTLIMIIPQHAAHASLLDMWGVSKFGDLVTQLVAEVVNVILGLASWILSIAGFLLNFSMSITLNIKTFVQGTEAVYSVWKTIRDISGMFIIFLLLFAAIRMILGFDSKMGNLIKTIVTAGILINFSFFIAGLGIDVSNVVSMQLYNAIAPENTLTGPTSLDSDQIKQRIKDGGISDIFMQSLKIVNLYDSKALLQKNDGSALSPSLKIIFMGTVGIIIIFTAAASFALAALAFIVRFVILIFLMAFSPIWLAAYAIPQLAGHAKKWTELYVSQLTFMPAYLLLMYFAMKILSSNQLFGTAHVGNLTSSDAWYANFLVIAVNAALVIILLNAPLAAAMTLGAKVPKKLGEGVDALEIWKKVGSWGGRNSVGRLASRVNESNTMRNMYANNPRMGNLLSGGMSKISSAGFGGGKKAGFDQARKSKVEGYKKFAEGLGYDDRQIDARKGEVLKTHNAQTDKIIIRAGLLKQRRDSYLNTPTRTKEESDNLKKLADADTKELEKLEKEIENRNNAETQKKVMDKEVDVIKNERKNKVVEEFASSRTLPAELIRAVSGEKLFKGANKFNKAVAAAIKKEKKPTDEIIDALKGELGKKDGDSGGKDEKK